MVFSGLPFLFIFLPVTLIVYYLVPRRLKNCWLFIASLFFYGYGEPIFLLLMIGSIPLNFISGLLIGRFADRPKPKRLTLILCIIINIGLLAVFKYTGLFVGTAKMLPVFSFLPDIHIALPIGISFYTFQTMSYVIDTYRGRCAPQKNFITFGTYVALFPQLIAGPIVRYVDVEMQLNHRTESFELFTKGVRLFLVGLMKKLLIANQMGVIWDSIVASPDSVGALGHWFGIIAFSLQIYFDFSGYSDMARGLGNMFGFEFLKNFDYPYISRSITEFWRRWHISLGTWFKEYVYIPLGGNRRGKARLCLNIFIVWALTGLWHGASWNFLIWGVYFGVLLIIEKFFLLKILEKLPKFVSHIYSLIFILFGWLIFQFTSVPRMLEYLSGMFSFDNLLGSADSVYLIMSNLLIMAVAIFACLPVGKKIWYKVKEYKFYKYAEPVVAVVILIICTAVMVSSTYNPFLYFRF